MSRVASTSAADPIAEIRIQDPYVIQLVTEEQARTGEKSATKVAARLISERMAIREVKPEQPAPST